jgi:RNA polymerase sporulation-specific sigma factor
MSDKEYSLFSDKDLVAMAGHGDLAAEEYLLNKYSSLVRYEIRFLYIAGAEVEDLMQEGMIGLFTAIRSYDIESDVQFSTFATTCIRNKVKTYITSANRKKHIPLNTYISIYAGEHDEDDAPILDLLIDDAPSPEEKVLKDERMKEMYEEIDRKLSPVEKKVVRLYIQGASHSEIARAIGKEEKAVSNALTRIRNKLKGQ